MRLLSLLSRLHEKQRSTQGTVNAVARSRVNIESIMLSFLLIRWNLHGSECHGVSDTAPTASIAVACSHSHCCSTDSPAVIPGGDAPGCEGLDPAYVLSGDAYASLGLPALVAEASSGCTSKACSGTRIPRVIHQIIFQVVSGPSVCG